MSGLLWTYFLNDDLDSFRQVLEEAAVASRSYGQERKAGGQGVVPLIHVGSIGGFSTSPNASYDARRAVVLRASTDPLKSSFHDIVLGRTDINRKDGKGMTLLHYAASSVKENSFGFAAALIEHPLIDLHIQDLESGWTALHRAFYFGNIATARAILEREAQDAIGEGSGGGIASNALSLIKMKDREGNGPYDLLTATIKDRTLQHRDQTTRDSHVTDQDNDELEESDPSASDSEDGTKRKALVSTYVDVDADELFTFGSNKNNNLGLGNEDDRQYPQRVSLRRPNHLYKSFFKEHIEQRANDLHLTNLHYSEKLRSQLRHARDVSELPAVVRFRPSSIQDVQMSKFHSAVLTSDPVSNLYMCGHGLGGRLGTGNEKTQFNFTCIEEFPCRKRIIAVALGQDHSLAVSDQGEVFSWGSNAFGQLGLGISKISGNSDETSQLLPKQIFGILKREVAVGVAASRIHSVVHTAAGLYTFGKNEGQLGIVDAHAGSLEIQAVPRRVAASRFSCGIRSLCAIDRATVCLLDNNEVHVFANYGITKLSFPLDGFTNYFLKKSFLATRYDESPNCVVKITGGGDTICALSSAGEVFAVTVGQCLDPGSSSTTSTTNPNKIKAALSTPARIWSLKKGHMSARDIGVDQDGSIILSTEAGSVWRRTRRPNMSSTRGLSSSDKKTTEFKFSRVPGLTRVMAVRASASGAYCAMRRDCNVTRVQIHPSDKSLWNDIATLLSFKNLCRDESSDAEDPVPRFWSKKPDALARLVRDLAQSSDLEREISETLQGFPNERCGNYDACVCSTISDVRIPLHQFILAGRSRPLRLAFVEAYQIGLWTSDLCSITFEENGRMLVTFPGLDFLTLVELVLYLYTDRFVGFWLRSKHAPQLAFRYRQVRAEVMKVACRLELKNLESAARRVTFIADLSLDKDIEHATMEPIFFRSGDAVVELADGNVMVHVDLISRRCPFFEGLFQGRAAGRWLAERRGMLSGEDTAIRIDLKHIETHVFQLVLRHIYADTGDELFDDVVTKDLDDFLDLVLEVLSVANELMLDRLSQICQMVLGRYVNVRNICQILNAVAPSAVTDFKDAGLEYLCLNLEAMLSTHLLDELDEDLLHQLDIIVRDNQLTSMPSSTKSGRAEALLHQRHPELMTTLHRQRQAKIDSINLQFKFSEHGHLFGTSFDQTCGDGLSSAFRPKARPRTSAPTTPIMKPHSPLVELSDSVGDSNLRLRQQMIDSNGSRSFPSEAPSLSGNRSPPAGVGQVQYNKMFGMLPPAAQDGIREEASSPLDTMEENRADGAAKCSPLGRPWGVTPLASAKLGIQEIMQQASSRTSNISLGLASQIKPEERTSASFTNKISQKERRKLQQQQPQSGSLSSSPASSSLPWQNVSSKSKSFTKDVASGQKTPTTPSSVPSDRSTTTPQLTMRQTVANTPSTWKHKEAVLSSPQITSTSLPQRSVSTPQAIRSGPPSSNPSSSSPRPVHIQSVRHTPHSPSEASPSFYMHQSMADILSQQEAEKFAKREAVAKRSLMEIQQEQEFLSWWDQESKKMMDEEAKAAKGASERGRGHGRGRGGLGRGKERSNRGRGKGKEKSVSQLGTTDRGSSE